jgi:hypothetical protein
MLIVGDPTSFSLNENMHRATECDDLVSLRTTDDTGQEGPISRLSCVEAYSVRILAVAVMIEALKWVW